MPPTTAAMELKVLISIMQSGTALQTMMSQVGQLSTALTKLQQQAAAGGGGPVIPPIPPPTGLNQIPPAGKAAQASMEGLERSINKVVRALQFMAGGFLALQSVRFIKGLADAAAHNQVLGTVLNVVALNAGKTTDEIGKLDKQVQRLGITIAASRQALTQFLQARLDVKFAPALARAAQDLAVISGVNSSDTFKRLIVNIQQLDTLGLRMMGLVIDRAAAEKKYKEEIGATTRELTKREAQQAFMNAVLEKAKGLEGAYSSAMNDVEKQIASLDRLTETYRSTLGETLLPAYSAIVAEIIVMYEKLTIQAQIFSSNRERAEALAEDIRTLARAFTSAAVFAMEHLDTIVKLVKWYLELKAVLLFFRGAAAAFGWVILAIDWFTKLRLAIIAVNSGMVTLKVAMTAMGAASVADALAMLKLAAAQTAVAGTAVPAATGVAAVGTAATVTTAAVTGLSLAWTRLASLLAIPLVGYIIYKVIAKQQEYAAKTPLERGAESRRGLAEYTGEPERDFTAPMLRMWSPLGNAFREWKDQHPEIVAMLKTEAELVAEFNRQVALTSITDPFAGITQDLAKAREELTAAQTARQQLLNPPEGQPRATMGERAAADERVKIATDALTTLRETMDKEFRKTIKSEGTKELFAQFDKIRDLQRDLGKTRADPNAGRAELAGAEAALEVEKGKLKVMIEQTEERLLTANITNEQRKQDEIALAHLKTELQELADSTEAITTARQQVFGGKYAFSEQGISSGGFGKVFGGYQTMVTEAQKLLEREGKIPKELADSLRLGLEALGESAKMPLDLVNLRKLIPDLEKMEKIIPGITAKVRQAMGVAQQGVQKEGLSFLAPIEAKQKERIKLRADEEQAALQKELELTKTHGQFLLEEQQFQYGQQLIGLHEYHKTKREVIQADGQEELRLQDLKIKELRELAAATRDPDAKRAAELQVVTAEQQRLGIQRRVELELTKDINQELTDRIKLYKDLRTAEFAFAAQQKGQQGALDQLNHSLEEEAKKYRQLLTDAENFRKEGREREAQEAEAAAQRGFDLLLMRQQVGVFDILNKARDREHQIRLGDLERLKQQVDLQEKARGLETARVEAGVAAGVVTDYEAQQFRNEQIQAGLAENRRRRAAEALILAENEAAMRQQLLDIEQQGVSTGKTRLEITLEQQEAQIRWNAILQGNEAAILDLDAAFISLEASTESYGRELKKAFVDEFSAALQESITNFKEAGETWINMANSIRDKILAIFVDAFSQRLFKRLGIFSMVDQVMNRIFGGGGGPSFVGMGDAIPGGTNAAEGGLISGPGTGTSDSVPIMASTGEHIMPAGKTAQFLPLLEGIRTGKILPFAKGGVVQSIAIAPLIPRRYAAGGVVVADGGAGSVQTGGGAGGNMVVSLHPDAMNMTMRDWLEHEVVRQKGRR